MELLEQRLRLELQEPAGKSWARLWDAVGRLPANLPLCTGFGPCLHSPIHLVLPKCACFISSTPPQDYLRHEPLPSST